MSSKEIKVPQLAESITEGTIVKWLVSEGDAVEKDTPIVELETDKVNVEINTDYSGMLEEIIAGPGTDVEVGETIARIAEGASEEKSEASEEKKAGKGTETGDETSGEEPVIGTEKETNDKTTEEKEEAEDKEVKVGKTTEEPAEEAKEEASDHESAKTIPATPSARRYAREHGINLNSLDEKLVQAFGRIGKREAELLHKHKEEETAETQNQPQEDVPDLEGDQDRPVERKRMSRRRMTIAKRLVEAQHEAAMLTTFNEIDMTEIMQIRKDRKEKFKEKYGVKLGFMSFFTKAVVAALKDFPLLNAEIEGNELILKKFYDIGIAVSADEGLVVPVVRNADQLDFAGIEKEIGELGKKARDNKLEIADLQGGSFTITNGGVFGSLLSTPILNSPQVGILGMHTIQKRPVAMPDDTIAIRPMMYVALSYDHRIVDGKEAVQFLVRLKECLEDPYEMFL